MFDAYLEFFDVYLVLFLTPLPSKGAIRGAQGSEGREVHKRRESARCAGAKRVKGADERVKAETREGTKREARKGLEARGGGAKRAKPYMRTILRTRSHTTSPRKKHGTVPGPEDDGPW